MARDISARPRSQRARVIPTKFLRAECETMVRTVRHLNLASQAELDALRPGGAENPATDAFGWLAFYRRLHRLHARVETRGASGDALLQPSQSDFADDEIVLGALRQDPLTVEMVDTRDGSARSLTVHVLSEHALRHLDALDDLLTCLARHAAHLQASQNPEDHALRLRLMEEITYQRLLCVWICTSDAWPRLPYDPRVTPRPELPHELLGLSPVDSVRVQAAHHRLNGVALSVARRLVSIDDDGNSKGGSWRTFFSTLEHESNGTIPAAHFMRDRPLVSLLASRIIAADAEKKAYDDAKAKAEAEAKQR